MNSEPTFDLGLPAYSLRRLSLDDVEAVQRLYEQCLDYMLLVDDRAADPHAVVEEFHSVPPGRSHDDKFLLGIAGQGGELVGLLNALRGYPDEATWWIGLLLLVPEVRSRGLGRRVVQAFAGHVRARGGQAIMLGVVEDNESAYRFWQRLGFDLVRTTEPRPFGNKTHRVRVMRRSLLEAEQFTEST